MGLRESRFILEAICDTIEIDGQLETYYDQCGDKMVQELERFNESWEGEEDSDEPLEADVDDNSVDDNNYDDHFKSDDDSTDINKTDVLIVKPHKKKIQKIIGNSCPDCHKCFAQPSTLYRHRRVNCPKSIKTSEPSISDTD